MWGAQSGREGGKLGSIRLALQRKGCGDGGMTHACKLEDFGSQVLENCGNIDSGLGANTHLVLGIGLEETLDTTAGELETARKVSDKIIRRDSDSDR